MEKTQIQTEQTQKRQTQTRIKRTPSKDMLRIIPLGGLGEIGKNMTLLEYGNKILIIDIGLKFPGEAAPGIDFIIPNVSYLKGKEGNIVGVIFTHGHFDHIGAIPFLIDKIGNKIPMFAGALARGIILKRQAEYPEKGNLNIKAIKNGEKVKLGPFEIEFIGMNHNIPDNFGFLIKTPVGNIFHTSDFKFDKNPINDKPTNFNKLRAIGDKNVLLLMSDSTGAEEEGHSLSEKEIMDNLEKIFKTTKGRIVISTFSSLINRIQQVITLSEKYNRKIAIEGYSMKSNIEIAKTLNYIKVKEGMQIETKKISRYSDNNLTIICTGAQGEDQAALMRIANKKHRFIKLKPNDTVVFSSSVIPGNERSVQMVKDNILRQKANVFHYKMMDIHAGGHAKKDELLEMMRLIRPKFFIPVHGQYSMLVEHAKLAREKGRIPEKNIIVAENGDIITLSKDKISVARTKVPIDYVMVDGSGIGDIGEIVLRDRKILADDGIFVVITVVDSKTGRVMASPDIISRGFIYLRESRALLAETRKKVIQIIDKASDDKIINWTNLKEEIKSKIGGFLYSKTERRPIVLPVIIEI